MGGIRLFLAISLPLELQRQLGFLQHELKAAIPGFRTTAPGNLHISLQFLGLQPAALLERLGDLLQAVAAGRPAFPLPLKGLGSFPAGKHPRVLWLGVEPVPSLIELQATLAAGLCRLGLAPDPRPYRPHLTLGRLRFSAPAFTIPAYLESIDCGCLQVNGILLFRSLLRPQGVIHHPLYQVELSASDGSGP
jgi:2'-5' RNA ligase